MTRRRWWMPIFVCLVVTGITAASYRHLSTQSEWRETFFDDFDSPVAAGQFPGTTYRSRWNVYPDGWKDTSGQGAYAPSKVLSVQKGLLNFALRTENGVPLGAATVANLPNYGQTYGRFEVRFRAGADGPGYGLAFLLWPDSEKWPADGEIDFPEGDLTGTITATAHHADAGGGKDPFDTSVRFGAWHTAVIEWLPGRIRFLLDGHEIGASTEKVPSRSMHWVLQAGTNGVTTPAPSVRGWIQVDVVTVYEWQGGDEAQSLGTASPLVRAQLVRRRTARRSAHAQPQEGLDGVL